MGTKDITEKRLEDYADVFADIVNVLLFDGEEKIDPSDLLDALPRSIYKADGDIHEQERDVAKYWNVNGVNIALLGLENQTNVFNEMPIRLFGYDGASYRQILNERDDAKRNGKSLPRIYPVISIVLYFGDKHWTAPKTLKELLDIPYGFEEYVDDYRMNLFEIQYLSDETVSKFKSDFRYVAELMTQSRKVREGTLDKISLTRKELLHSQEVLELMKVMTGDDRFEKAFNEQVEGGSVDMFALFDTYESRGFLRGQEEGFSKGRKEGFNKGRKEGKSEGLIEGADKGFSLFEQIGSYLKENPDATNEELIKAFKCTEDRINSVRAFLTR